MSTSKSRRDRRRNLSLVQPSLETTADVAPPSEPREEVTVLPRPASVRKEQKPHFLQSGILYALRVGMLGAGLSVFIGTLLATLTPTRFLSSQASTVKGTTQTSSSASPAIALNPQGFLNQLGTLGKGPTPTAKVVAPEKVTATTENAGLKQKLATLASQAKPQKILPQAYLLDMDNGQFVNLQGEVPIAAASTIKIPVAIAFFQAVDAGKIQLHEPLPMTKDVIASGAGDMQYLQGKKSSFTALETVTKMIVISDNTATNMIIKRLGGKAALNQRFQQWGLATTVINNALPDLEGTNKTSPQDLVTVLAKVNQGELLSLKSRDRLLNIMQQTKTRTLLPQGLEEDAVIAHKTGDIGKVLGDAGIIDMPNGKRYIFAVMAQRPYNDPKARELIQNFSRTSYQHLKNTTPAPPAATKVAANPASKPPAATNATPAPKKPAP